MNALAKDARARLSDYPWDMLNQALVKHPLLVLRAVQKLVRRGGYNKSNLSAHVLLARIQPALRAGHPKISGGSSADELRQAARILKEQLP